MAKRKKKENKFKQLDIISAINGKEKFFEEEKEETKSKSIGLFDFINDIRKTKKCDLLDEEENISKWNNYMILYTLSMKEKDVPLLNYFNKYIGSMSKKQMYISMTHLIPKDYKFYKFIKNSKSIKDECIKYVSKYYEISYKEAYEYIDILGEEWSNSIKDKFGGLKGKR